MASTGQPRWPTPSRSCAPTKGVSTTLVKPTYWPKCSRRSPSHGHSRSGGLIWSGPSKGCPGATYIYLLPWTSSQK
jgi:hypothetical protein